jgi:hypothetical protein
MNLDIVTIVIHATECQTILTPQQKPSRADIHNGCEVHNNECGGKCAGKKVRSRKKVRH